MCNVVCCLRWHWGFDVKWNPLIAGAPFVPPLHNGTTPELSSASCPPPSHRPCSAFARESRTLRITKHHRASDCHAFLDTPPQLPWSSRDGRGATLHTSPPSGTEPLSLSLSPSLPLSSLSPPPPLPPPPLVDGEIELPRNNHLLEERGRM